MTRTLTHLALAASALLIAGCGSAPVAHDAGSAPAQVPAAAPSFITPAEARATKGATSACPFSPDVIARMLEAGQPLPRCVRKLIAADDAR